LLAFKRVPAEGRPVFLLAPHLPAYFIRSPARVRFAASRPLHVGLDHAIACDCATKNRSQEKSRNEFDEALASLKATALELDIAL
jgi:hypothetical protein